MKRLRIVSYAINGRGIGHLVRQLAILRWIRRITALIEVPCECWVLTSSEADTLARREDIPALKMPSKSMLRDAGIEPSRYLTIARTWVLNAIAGLQPHILLVDTFPGGSFGELLAALELVPHRVLVARRVRGDIAENDAYRALLPLYQTHIAPDERQTGPILIRERSELLSREAARLALGVAGDARAVYVTLGGGGDVAASSTLPVLTQALKARGWHVVVGAGPLYQGPELRGAGITWIDRYVPLELFPGVDVAVSAGGYNAFHELMYAGVPTVFLPQPRIADDQEERVRRAQEAGAGRVAGRLEDVPELVDALAANPDAAAHARALVPENGARAAALAALAPVLPAADLRMAADVLTPWLLDTLARHRAVSSPGKVLDLVRLLSGGTPSELARRRAAMADLMDSGITVDPQALPAAGKAHEHIARFFDLLDASGPSGLNLEISINLMRSLRQKFPAAGGKSLLDAAELLFPAWARFGDWMGAVALMRAIPVQRSLDVGTFAASMTAWLAHEEDLFDALRSFSHLEAAGQRTVVEVLHILTNRLTNRPGTMAEAPSAAAATEVET